MNEVLEFLLRHGYLVLFGWVFAEQLGMPVPSIPLLLAAGALAGQNRLNFFASLAVVAVGAVLADSIWYQLGRLRGIRILRFLCRISLEPDSCVRRTEGIFAKQGARSLLLAKFLPGLSTVAPPLAGIFQMRPRKFLLFDALGALVWAAAFLSLGYVFSGQLEIVAAHALRLGGGLVAILVASLALYLGWKIAARQRFLRDLRIARITPEELKQKLDRGEDLVIVDLRHALDFELEPETIPGAFRMDARDLEASDERLPAGREVILYCT